MNSNFVPHLPPRNRQVFCNRTLNLKGIKAIGYDMDYTLIHYFSEKWEERAYDTMLDACRKKGLDVSHFKFRPELSSRGLVIDRLKGNLVKPNRFGYVKSAMHGTKRMSFDEQQAMYSRTTIDLADSRWVFLNTLFSISEGCIYLQLVDMLDQHKIPGVLGYTDVYDLVKSLLEITHLESALKNEIISSPETFVDLDPDLPQALLDQKRAGKKLLLITNSEWFYTSAMMDYSFNRFLTGKMIWQDLFDVMIVSARKPNFFSQKNPFFEVINPQGDLRVSSGKFEPGKVYFGGNADAVEKNIGLTGDEILYVGDHPFSDVHVTKNIQRWRTALILRELENEIEAEDSFRDNRKKLSDIMGLKQELEWKQNHLKLALNRLRDEGGETKSIEEVQALVWDNRQKQEAYEREIVPLVQAESRLTHPVWGPLMRAGNDKSYLAYQMERYADIYTSRVSNLRWVTPYGYLRSHRGMLPHDL